MFCSILLLIPTQILSTLLRKTSTNCANSKHAMMMNLLQKHYFAPIGDNPQQILDLGTGTGKFIWLLSLRSFTLTMTGIWSMESKFDTEFYIEVWDWITSYSGWSIPRGYNQGCRLESNSARMGPTKCEICSRRFRKPLAIRWKLLWLHPHSAYCHGCSRLGPALLTSLQVSLCFLCYHNMTLRILA